MYVYIELPLSVHLIDVAERNGLPYLNLTFFICPMKGTSSVNKHKVFLVC